MTYTLFVDESGNFDRDRARWVVAGVVVPGDPVVAEKTVADALAPVLSEHAERIVSPEALHLYEFRKTSGARARRVADTALGALAGVPGLQVGAVRNRRGAVSGGRSGPKNTYERSYRLMLLDLVALLESGVCEPVTSLHLVVATRTYEGTRMSRLGEIGDDVLGHLAEAVEAGLAARGLLEAAGTERLHHEFASGRWALAAADVVANVAFHEPDRDGEDRALIGRHEASLGYRVFDAFGGYDLRRARVAERDGDLPLALARWAAYRPGNAAERRERGAALDRLAATLLSLRDPYGSRATVEAALERLRWDWGGSPEAMGKALRSVEDALAAIDAGDGERVRLLLFRVRSFARDFAHRRADASEAARLDLAQAERRAAVAASPEGFPLVLDDDARALNQMTQSLDLLGAVDAARAYRQLVGHYGEVWELVGSGGERKAFARGRVSLRAAQALARHLAFAAPLAPPADRAAWLDEADGLLSGVPEPSAADDRARLRNDRVLVALRRGEVGRALDLALAADEAGALDAYDHYYGCRAAAEGLLADAEAHRTAAEALYARAAADEDAFASGHNPLQLAWRERSLLAHLQGREHEAQAALAEAKARTGNLGGDAPIKRWLGLVLDVYGDAMEGRSRSVADLSHAQGDEDSHRLLVRQAGELAEKGGGGALAAVRACSPY